MKIQIFSHASERNPEKLGAWHHLANEFEKKGHVVSFLGRKNWLSFYFDYLKFKPDVLIVTGIIGALAVFLKRLKLIRCPIVYGWNDYFTEVMGKKWGANRVAFLEYYTVRYADVIVTPSIFLYNLATTLGKEVYYIPHGVDKEIFEREKIKLPGKFVVLYLGDQTGYKRVDLIIDAVKGLDCELYLMDKVNDELIRRAGNNVHFLGWIDHEKVGSYLKVADVLVITSDQDSTLKMFEYCEAGKTILARKGRIEYFLTHLENAYITNDLREGLIVLMKDRALRERLARNLRKVRIYSWEEVGELHLKILQRICR